MPTRAEVARVLRNARDLMNTNGRHWIKGDLKTEVDEDLIDQARSGHTGGIVVSLKAQVGDVAYCAWGGIAEVADDLELRVEAMEALVQIIDPDGWNYYLAEYEDYKQMYEVKAAYDDFRGYYPTFDRYWEEQLGNREEQLGDKIATWNDANKRTWEEVRASLTKAAAKAKQRAEVETG